MKIMLDNDDDFTIDFNEYMQFSLYDKEGKAKHFQVIQSSTETYRDFNTSVWSSFNRSHPHRSIRTIEAYPIKNLTVETAEEKVAKEAVKKAKESLKAAEDTLKAVKEKK